MKMLNREKADCLSNKVAIFRCRNKSVGDACVHTKMANIFLINFHSVQVVESNSGEAVC